jgi:hypothetical protein
MILQTFATHFVGIVGAVKVPALGILPPHCALALSAASVRFSFCRSLFAMIQNN